MSAPAVVVIGLGNHDRGDDAAGLLVARRVATAAPAGWRVLAYEGDGSELPELLAGAGAAVLADAVAVPPGAAGRILRLDASRAPLPATPFARTSSHALGLAEGLELARALGALPPRVVVWGVGGARFDVGGAPAAAVRRAAESVAARILAEADARPAVRAGARCRGARRSPAGRT